MPFPLIPVIAGAASLLGTGAQAAAQGNMNRKNREFAEKQYQQQKQDSLDFWHQNNAYNSPQEQMKRLQEAGLNPNLVYGNGTVANSASAPATPNQAKYEGKTADFQGGATNALQGYFSTQMMQANLDNTKLQNAKIVEDTLLTQAQRKAVETTTGIKTDTKYDVLNKYHFDSQTSRLNYENKAFDLSVKEALKDNTFKQAANQLAQQIATRQKTEADTSRINDIIKSQAFQRELQQFEIDLNKNGMTRNDELLPRLIVTLFKKFGLL